MNLQNLDPEIKSLLEINRKELESLQENKEQAIDEFIEEATEDKLL